MKRSVLSGRAGRAGRVYCRHWGRLRGLTVPALLVGLAACGGTPDPGNDDAGQPPADASTVDASTGGATSIRVHYRLQAAGDAMAWGVHFWGAGSTSPTWGSPQRFTGSDDFGVYTDVKVTATGDSADGWLGMIPVQCSNNNCKKDVETSVRFFDLTRSAKDANIAECWITQGQAVQTKPPVAGGVAYKINRPKDFIELGNGSVRLMFRVPQGSTGQVSYGAAAATLDKSVTWNARDDINKSGVVLSGVGAKVYYKIASSYQGKTDETAVQELTPQPFTPVEQAADFATWGQRGVMYQLLVRTFADGGTPKAVADGTKESGIDSTKMDGTGDLVGLRGKLPYLKDLGIDAIWMTPVFRAKSYHGYDTTDFYDLDPDVGTLKDFQDLTTEAHKLGIRIVLDLVQNHVADVNPWFVAGIDPKSPTYAKYHDWFVFSDEYSNMYTDPHPWDQSAVIWACKNYQCYHQIFGAAMPELNFRNPEVRAEMKKIAAYWIKLGADGYRLDASKHIEQFDDNNAIDQKLHGTHAWWKEFNYYVKKVAPRPAGVGTVLLAGENRWDDPAQYQRMVPFASDMDSQFDFPFRTVLSNLLTGKTGDGADVIKYLNQVQDASAQTAAGGNASHFYERFLSNHDLDRPATQFASMMPLHSLLKQAATVVMTMPGMPVIYYGEEFGKLGQRTKYQASDAWDHDEFIREPMSWFQKLTFTGDMKTAWDIDFAKSNTDNAGLNLGAGQCRAANPDYRFIKFMAADEPASWAAQKGDPASLYAYYKQLIVVRKGNTLLTDATAKRQTLQNTADLYSFSVTQGAQALTVVLNRKASAQTVTQAKVMKDLLSGVSAASFAVPAYGALILQ